MERDYTVGIVMAPLSYSSEHQASFPDQQFPNIANYDLPFQRPSQNPQSHPYLRWHIRFWLYIVLALSCKYSDDERSDTAVWLDICEADYQSCPRCFTTADIQIDRLSFLQVVQIEKTFTNIMNRLFSYRSMQYAVYMDSVPAIVQHDVDIGRLRTVAAIVCAKVGDCTDFGLSKTDRRISLEVIANHYANADEVDGVQLYPTSAARRFVRDFGANFTNPMMRWALMHMNAAPMLMATLYGLGFPVPRLLLTCGFVMVQSNEGLPLDRYYGHKFTDRVYIAQQLLEAAVLFTNGHAGFRFYLTDATSDNIVVHTETLRVSFVDLDGVVAILADQNPFSPDDEVWKHQRWSTVHRHEEIEACTDCFAFVVEDLFDHHISDMNIFSICQLLTKGLLDSIPYSAADTMKDLPTFVLECQRCGEGCPNRFNLAQQLIDFFKKALETQN